MKLTLALILLLSSASAFSGPDGTIHEYHIDVSDVIIETGNEFYEIALSTCREHLERYDRHEYDGNNADLIVYCSTGGI